MCCRETGQTLCHLFYKYIWAPLRSTENWCKLLSREQFLCVKVVVSMQTFHLVWWITTGDKMLPGNFSLVLCESMAVQFFFLIYIAVIVLVSMFVCLFVFFNNCLVSEDRNREQVATKCSVFSFWKSIKTNSWVWWVFLMLHREPFKLNKHPLNGLPVKI